MNYIEILLKLAPLVTDLAPLVAQMIASISAQGGKDIDTIIAETLPQLDANEAKLLADMAKEQAAIAGGAK